MPRCVIFTAGDQHGIEKHEIGLRHDDFVICCDAGYRLAQRLGVRPDLLLGDFDSYTGALPEDIPVQRYIRDKDDTDTVIAVRYALEHGYDSILLVAATGGVNVFENYANVYMGGVANMVLALFPIFLGGQMFGKMLEMSGLPMAVASGVFRKLGPASAVAAVYLATLAMSVGGIDVFVIIFTMYPLAAAFFKAAGISRSLIPACVLGGAVAMQTLPGMPINNIVLPANAFGTTPMAGFWMAIAGFAIVGGGNLWYLHRAGQKYIAKGEGFIPREGDTDDVDLNTEGLPNPFLLLIPMGIVVLLLNLIHWPAWAALFIGCVVLALMFWKRYEGFHKIVNTMAEGAKNSQSVIQTAAICGLASVVGAVPGYNLLLGLLEKASFGSPYIMLFVCIAVIAGFTGSATGGLAFVLDNFTDKLVAMGGNPEALTRIANISQITFDSLPHNSAIVLTLSYCGVTHKEGYKHLFVVTVVTTTLATIVNIIMAHLGVI